MVQETIIGDLRKHGITLISVHEPDLLQADPTRTLLRQMVSAIAEYEKNVIVLKLRGARQRMKAGTGRCEGAKPYGTREGEAATLKARPGSARVRDGLRQDCSAPGYQRDEAASRREMASVRAADTCASRAEIGTFRTSLVGIVPSAVKHTSSSTPLAPTQASVFRTIHDRRNPPG